MTPQQGDLFSPKPVPRIDRRLPQPERRRLSAQCASILDRLEHGPASNLELSAIALRYSARIKELRDAGYVIEITETDHATGRRVYRLKEGN